MPIKDAISLLKEQHDAVKKQLAELTQSTERAGKRRGELIGRIQTALQMHTKIEEEIFYPAFRDAAGTRKDATLYYEAVEEHHAVDGVLADIQNAEPTSPQFGGKAKVLQELVLHHANEEEKEMFPRAKKVLSKEELRDLGERMMERMRELARPQAAE